MHIAIYHDAVIPPPKYGGTERAIFWLARTLAEMGHQVSLIANRGSSVPGVTVIPIGEKANWQTLIPTDADIVHLFGTPHVLPPKPFLVTIEGNGQPGEKFHVNTVFVSRKHAENHASAHFVYNGLDPDEFPCDEKREDFLVFLAKASWSVKNLEGAIEVARASGMRLEVMGSRNWPLNLHRCLPAIRGVRYRGMVGDIEKRAVLRKARALLFPVRWHEPFGIAITEALASGCAVLGTPYGSLPEIVTPETGALSTSAADLVDALKIRTFSPRACRERIFAGFTHRNMAEKYLQYYQTVLEKGALSGTAPYRTSAPISPLPWTHLTP